MKRPKKKKKIKNKLGLAVGLLTIATIYKCVSSIHFNDLSISMVDKPTLVIGTENLQTENRYDFDLDDIQNYYDSPSVEINNNIPYFTKEEITTEEFEDYSNLDELGRCGQVYINASPYTMPTEERGQIGNVRPTGWDYNGKSNNNKYPELISDRYVYNRCHLAAFCLSGENDNPCNLITGTRYMNVEGMLPYEEMVSKYIDETKNHVLYRVTPIYEADNLIASGVLMEAYSVEDNGKGIQFCVYCYNVQPGISINYTTGQNKAL